MMKFWVIFISVLAAAGLLLNPSSNAFMWVSEPGSGVFSILAMVLAIAGVLAGAGRIVWQFARGSMVFKIFCGLFLGALLLVVLALYQGGHLQINWTVGVWILLIIFSLLATVAWHVSTGGGGAAAIPLAKKGI